MAKIRVGSLFFQIERNAIWKMRRHTKVVFVARRWYAISTMDRFDQRYVEVGHVQNIVPLDDGEVAVISGSGSSVTLTRGAYAVSPRVEKVGNTLYVSVGRMWLSVF